MTDVDAVNERINGLVNLLHVVGIDGANPDALSDEQKRISGMKKSNASSQGAGAPGDNQILEIIRKLQQAQADSPEILAALQSPELRALASLAAQRQSPAPAPAPRPAPSLDDVMEDDDDNYPKIGPGYSDDISVVSDLTTPTVMTRQQVAEEEYYKDVNGGPGAMPPLNIALGPGPAQPSRPPMSIGGGNVMPSSMMANNMRNPPKTKNLVNQIRPGATRRAIAAGKAGVGVGAGGAAAQRRHNYQQAMAKLQSNGPSDFGAASGFAGPDSFFPSAPSGGPSPADFPSMSDSGKKARPLRKPGQKAGKSKKSSLASQEMHDASFDDTMASGGSRGSGSSLSRKKSSGSHGSGSRADVDWGSSHGSDVMGSASGWPSFDSKSSKKKGGSKEKDTFVDNDGFFASGSFGTGDPFTPSPTKSPMTRRKQSETRDDGQGGTRSRRAKAPDNSWASEKTTKKEREKKSKGRSRRASLAM